MPRASARVRAWVATAAALAGAAAEEHPAAASATAAASAADPSIPGNLGPVLPLRSFTLRQNTGFPRRVRPARQASLTSRKLIAWQVLIPPMR